ncbi:MAG TPA: carboxypeptidase regulatory-like domain-containing protein [Verrucomicrobiae bacterium]|nr:carboxypeptidase regulatory-like domain-containing protein [Verrucomicrobiae bacterium]
MTAPSDLVPGPIARGTVGDLVIENNRLRVIVQKGGRNWYNISQFGGNIIDALPKAADGSLLGQDNFEEFVLGTNIESVPNYQSVTVADAGGENPDGSCKPAVVRATAEFDDLMDFVNGSSAIRGISPLQFPPSADDFDLPFRFETDYTLEDGKRYVTIRTRLINQSAQQQRIYLVEYLNGSGEVEAFQSGYGFGEPFATAPCTSCNFVAYAGHEGGAGVSYGLIHDNRGTSATAGSTSVSVSGVTVLLYGRDILLVATTPEQTQPPRPDSAQPVGPNGPNFVVPANGEVVLTRHFAVADGTVASIVDIRNELVPPAGGIGTLTGTVTDAAGPVAGAEIAVLTSGTEGFPVGRGPSLRVVNHFRTDAAGRFSGTQAAGAYTLRVNVPGRLAATPNNPGVTVAANAITTQNFTVPASSGVRVLVKDASGNSVAAKVQLLGLPDANDPDGAEPLNQESVLGGQLIVRTGVFGDPAADPLPPRVRLAEFAVLDTLAAPIGAGIGDTGVLAIEPGTYDVVVSAGPRYSRFSGSVAITAGNTATVNASVIEVLPTPGYIHADFHVHSINSPDSEVTNRERVATYLAEGIDFFTPSDHDVRVDFAPIIAAMGVAGAIATAPGAEVTTFDYGHFNFWPVKIETNSPNDELPNEGHSHAAKIGAGATDWGGQAPLGKDFPCVGNSTPCAARNFSLTPGAIFASAAFDPFHSGETVVRQINHVHTHFGNAGGTGLGIDTAATGGPASTVPPARRRLDPAIANHYSDDYDTLEILIGDALDYQNETLYDENMGDWFNLLNQGKAKVGVSNSDTHQRRVTSMQTRNQISVPDALLSATRANFAAISADPHAVGDSVRAGLTTMTNAPLLEVLVSEPPAVASLKVGRAFGGIANPLPSDGTVTVDITVKSPAWAPYNQILVFVNGDTERHKDQLGQPTSPPRYRVCGPGTAQTYTLNAAGAAGFTRTEVEAIPGNAGSMRFETVKQVTVNNPGGDFWIVVLVRGTRGVSPSMWPVVPNDFEDGADNIAGNADDVGVRALAMSNPIYVDVNGGAWVAPGVGNTTDACGQALPAP